MKISHAVAVLALLGACAGCSSSAPGGGAAGRSDALAALIVDDAPAGFAVRPEAASHTGPTDLAKAIRDDALPDARAALTAAAFEHGYQRLWTDASGDVVAVQLYRFGSAAGARTYLRRAQRIASRQASRVRTFTVTGVPRDDGSGVEVDVEGNSTEQVSAVSGRVVLELLCTSRDADGLRARAVTLAGAQYRRLRPKVAGQSLRPKVAGQSR